MLVKKISFKNFRKYYGYNEIAFDNSAEKSITLIAGMNGYGKTTFLLGLVWCLFGKLTKKVDDFFSKQIGSYQVFLDNSLNWKAKEESEESTLPLEYSVEVVFENVLLHGGSNSEDYEADEPNGFLCRELIVRRSYMPGNTSDKLEVFLDGKGNELTNNNETFIQSIIMPYEVAKFFFFDAEKIVNIADNLNKAETRKELSRAYSEILGIKKYADLRNDLLELDSKLKRDGANKEDQREYDELITKLNKCKTRLSETQKNIDEKKDRLSIVESKKQGIQNELIKLGNQFTEERVQEIRARNKDLRIDKENTENELKDYFELLPFVISGELMVAAANQIKDELNWRELESAASETRKRIEGVVEELNQVEPPNHLVVNYRVRRFFLDEVSKILNKHFSAGHKETTSVISDEEVIHDLNSADLREINKDIEYFRTDFSKNFESIISRYNKIETELDRNNKELRQAESNIETPKVAGLRKEEKKYKNEEEELERNLDELHIEIGNLESTIESLKVAKSKLDKRIKVGKENEAKHRVIAELIKSLHSFEEKFKESKKDNLQKKITNALDKLMHTKVISKVDVDIVDDEFYIQFYDDNNKYIDILQLSMGQRQLLATALLFGLVKEAAKSFPVFIDSPLQKLDPIHKQNVINNFYSLVSEQVVLTPIPGEVNEADFLSMENKVNRLYVIEKVDAGDKASVIKQVTNEEFIQVLKS